MARKKQIRHKNNQIVRPVANQKHKDTVFRMLFSDKKHLLSLYNAVNETNYQNPDDLEIVTLENAVYMGIKNDLSFIMDTNVSLYEHQSTINPNIPLRDLFYISSEYQKLIDKSSLYASTPQKIPAPNFIVFYNGIEPFPDFSVSRLSDAYENLHGEPNLELVVKTFNVNEGHNYNLMEHCQTLREYSQFVAQVRQNKSTMDLNTAINHAVDDCIKNNILADFLRKNRAEVISMSIFEYDKEEEEKKLRNAEFEAGREAGFLEGQKHAALQSSIESAKRMLKSNKLSPEDISIFSGLSLDEVKKLQL